MRGARRIVAAAVVAVCAGVIAGPAAALSDPPTRIPVPPVEKAKPKPAAVKKAKKPRPKPKPRVVRPKPRQQPLVLPWRRDGTSSVAHVRKRWVRVYASPRAKRPMLVLRKRDDRGTLRAFLVRSKRSGWLRVYLPTRPNGSLGWVRRRAVRLYVNRYRVVVRLRQHQLQLWKRRKLVATYPVAVGTRSTPTPRGVFYVVELLKPRNPRGSYGPYSFGISAHSRVLKYFAGGDGRVGVHGTNQPALIGSNVSHGCIRLRNTPIRRLARILPLGTPVYIRS